MFGTSFRLASNITSGSQDLESMVPGAEAPARARPIPASPRGRTKGRAAAPAWWIRAALALLVVWLSLAWLAGFRGDGGGVAAPAARWSFWGRGSDAAAQGLDDWDEGDEDEDADDGETGDGAPVDDAGRAPSPAAAPVATAAVPSMSAEERLVNGELVFLFLLQDSLPHADVWKAFLAHAPKGSYRAYAHFAKPAGSGQAQALAELGIAVVKTVPSAWCIDLVSPVVQLFTSAINADDGRGRPQKFVLLSESALPIQPMSRVRRVLLATDQADICLAGRREWASASIFGVEFSIVKHHQWAILPRRDVEHFLEGWSRLSRYESFFKDGKTTVVQDQYPWRVPRMGADGRANFSAAVPRVAIAVPDRCLDEEVFTSLIWGLHEPAHERFWADLEKRSVCRTYTNWDCKTCKTLPEVFNNFTAKLQELSQDWSDRAYLFARKFHRSANVKKLKKRLTRHTKSEPRRSREKR